MRFRFGPNPGDTCAPAGPAPRTSWPQERSLVEPSASAAEHTGGREERRQVAWYLRLKSTCQCLCHSERAASPRPSCQAGPSVRTHKLKEKLIRCPPAQEAVGTLGGPLLLSPSCLVWKRVTLGVFSSCLSLRGLGSNPGFPSSVVLGKFLNFSVLRFTSVENGSNISSEE